MLPAFSTTITTIAGPAAAIALHTSAASTAAAATATMTGRNIARLSRLAQQQQRGLRTLTSMPAAAARPVTTAPGTLVFRHRPTITASTTASPRCLTSTSYLRKIDPAKAVPAEITESRYHELADEYLETILSKFEELQDEGEDLDVEFSAGVMNLQFSFGKYVVNKQPPNKQIWLSSPKTGPKRYDWVVVNEGQDAKAGTGHGEWIYTRDGTTINDLFEAETGIDLTMPIPHYGE